MPARGSRPPCLGEPRGPRDWDQLRTMEQTADYASLVQILDPPVQPWEEELTNVLRFFLTRWPVPSRFGTVRHGRLSTCPRSHLTRLGSAWVTLCVEKRRRTSWWMCLRLYPILLRVGMWSRTQVRGFQGFRPRQDSGAFGRADHAEIPVPRRGFHKVFKVFPLDRVQQRVRSRPFTFQFRTHDLHPPAAADFPNPPADQGFFRGRVVWAGRCSSCSPLLPNGPETICGVD